MKLKILAIACILMLPLSLTNAQSDNAEPPGHEDNKGKGHDRHQGVGNGHIKFDATPS